MFKRSDDTFAERRGGAFNGEVEEREAKLGTDETKQR